jgi:hypothetical protein
MKSMDFSDVTVRKKYHFGELCALKKGVLRDDLNGCRNVDPIK